MADLSNFPRSNRPRNVSLQQQRLAQLQRQFDQAEKVAERLRKQIEIEQANLAKMAETSQELANSLSTPSVTPGQGMSSGANFQAQYDQFSATPSNKRLTTDISQPIQALGKIEPTKTDEPQYSQTTRAQHWDELKSPPPEPVYVSGYYYSSGEDTKRYEYLLWPGAYPVKVGEMVSAPVHPVGYHQGKQTAPGHDRRFIITDIYSQERFVPYHDIIR